ncbi:cache domain-containing sensor histidine kinase [Peribacillus kribbensis]|uniref:cache domain-containing sensor histidine kinase n=1 Tax=Peribacillus kribbensis TaxID=356658 RepID=UPI00042A703E|nr:sensor histidine kinase [Peribacillus kribbensis]
MFSTMKKWNTLRNQMLVVFLFVMAIVLLIISILTFNQVSSLLKKNAKEQIQQTAVEANGRLESLYEQINNASKLVATNNSIQSALNNKYENKSISFSEQQALMGIMNRIQANSEGIFSFELYTNDQERLLPLDDTNLTAKINREWIYRADQAKGQLVWIGESPDSPHYLMALRRVNLMSHEYARGGYLLISIYPSYFQFPNQNKPKDQKQYSILLDKQMQPILSNYHHSLGSIIRSKQQVITQNGQEYMVTKQTSAETGWTVIILTSYKALTKGVMMLRMGIIISGIIGFIIYFVCSLFLTTIITKPILKLTKTMQQASAGNLAINPEVPSANEISELNSTYNQLVKETNHLINMVYQKEITRNLSELKALQSQINPHFLFNTLDSFRWWLEDKEEEELAEVVVAMANLFRYTITKPIAGDWVTIKEEVQHIGDYMEIIKMRFGDHLKWNLILSKELERVKIPKLIIQPLVENAVLHGAGNTMHPCTITVLIKQDREEGFLQVMVQDDGSGISKEKLELIKKSLDGGGSPSSSGNGVALANVEKRLQLYYQTQLKQGLEIVSEVNAGTTVSFVIPN